MSFVHDTHDQTKNQNKTHELSSSALPHPLMGLQLRGVAGDASSSRMQEDFPLRLPPNLAQGKPRRTPTQEAFPLYCQQKRDNRSSIYSVNLCFVSNQLLAAASPALR